MLVDGSFPVWPENWATVLLFWQVQRLWRVKPFGGLIGLDWVQIQAMLALQGRRRLGPDVARLAIMEDAALAEFELP